MFLHPRLTSSIFSLQRRLITTSGAGSESRGSIAGTVQHHAAYLFLHAQQSLQKFPKVLEGNLYHQLKSIGGKWDEKCLVNVRYDGSELSESWMPGEGGPDSY